MWVRVGVGGVGVPVMVSAAPVAASARTGAEEKENTDHEQGNSNIQPGSTTFIFCICFVLLFFKKHLLE